MSTYTTTHTTNFLPYWEQRWAIAATLSEAGWNTGYDYAFTFVEIDAQTDTDVFVFEGLAGATYDIYSTSYDDPADLIIYDDQGEAIAFNEDWDYGEDRITDFVAPYTGIYYVDANWVSDRWDDVVTLEIYETLPTVTIPPDMDPYTGTTLDDALDIARLYNAAFDRLPDEAGLNYWIDQWEEGESLLEISTEFYYSREFSQTWGQLNNVEFVDTLYLNVLDRPADDAGLIYWTDQLEDGMPRGEVLARFADSIENVLNTEDMLATLHYAGYGEWLL